MAEYLKISSITDSKTVKKAAIEIDENKNDKIDTYQEWRTFINKVSSLFAKGSITVDVAKKYIDESSSIFISQNDFDADYVKGLKKGIDDVHSSFGTGSRLGRKISSAINYVDYHTSKFFGITAFCENIAEFMIFNSAITEQACGID